MIKKIIKTISMLIAFVLIVAIVLVVYNFDKIGLTGAAMSGNKEKVTYFISEKTIDPNKSLIGLNLISGYIGFQGSETDINFVKFLLKSGVNPNIYNHKKSFSPLARAIMSSREDVVKLLIKKGADVNALSHGDRKPLGYALGKRKCKIAEILISEGATLEGDKYEKTAKEEINKCFSDEEIARIIASKRRVIKTVIEDFVD